ncbi:hypothetical protein BZL29_1206 [Mycobacterium kansasii]|uniref:Uncharacterized protein n=1 Tax=Mycobacterium kansasii TaxID=1768 RepID=A0A1V3XXB1_MYCKA|nr:hypothetical protein BZL29_1206 [Mycobacterium kansasii]
MPAAAAALAHRDRRDHRDQRQRGAPSNFSALPSISARTGRE